MAVSIVLQGFQGFLKKNKKNIKKVLTIGYACAIL